MARRIVITGAESTGKSTLAQALSDHYGEPWTHEFVRGYVDQLDRELQPADLDSIARGQLALEDAGLEQAKRLVIHDTNIVSSIIYAQHYFGVTLEWVDACFRERKYDLYLFCMPDIPWKADEGQRESPEARAQLHRIFKTKLDSLKVPYVEIYGSKEERLQKAILNIEQLNVEFWMLGCCY